MMRRFSDHDNDDEDASLRLARELDAQLNGSHDSPQPRAVPRPQSELDADLAYAMQLDAEMNGSNQHSSTVNDAPNTYSADHDHYRSQPEVSIRGGGKPDEQYGVSQTGTGPGRTFSAYSDLAQYILSRGCTKCRTPVINSPDQVTGLFSAWIKGQIPISSLLSCQRCQTPVCMGCGTQGQKSLTEKTVKKYNVSWCCSRGRLFLIWVVLCGLDQAYSLTKQKERNAAKSGAGNLGRRRGDGVGYGGGGFGGLAIEDMLGGVGYFGGAYGPGRYHGRTGPASAPDPGKAKAEMAQSLEDQTDQFVFTMLADLLPDLDQNTHFDMDPPDAVTSMLLKSKVLEKAAELLRNDSLEDVAKRKGLYQAILDFLRVVGPHHKTGSAMFSERVVRPDTENLLSLSFANNTRSTPASAKQETSSLADCLRNLNVQSNMMMRGAQLNPGDFQTEEGQNLLWLCRQISDLANYLLKTTAAGTGAASKDVKENEDQAVVEADDNLIFGTHHYAGPAQQMRLSQQGRMKRLITELTTLKTGLPPGIFVKYASSRLDVMKFLIVGPEGTPYENGLFEFDLFCGHEYPYKSPKVLFKTTGGRIARFNPNLYADGKVCLSLLGTWQGEPWRPGQSTILQILISIQAMILCEDPIRNEPSQESIPRGSHMSHEYNKEVRRMTVQHAILPWLQKVPALWQDVAVKHFKKNGAKIMRTLGQWENDPFRSASRGDRFMHPGTMGYPGGTSGLSIQVLKPQVMAGLQKMGLQIEMPSAALPQQQTYGTAHATGGFATDPYNRRGYGGSQHGPYGGGGYGGQSQGRGGYGGSSGGGGPPGAYPGGYYRY
ncbi:hypothetical protein BDV96DRAFT_584595 [Lophiotrema nucula]|uniref:UBC core domain-containing protein n=1 Tax=Lophiotrema nucula TaxID=690887 RepID=A0A6A5YUL5_9PLEO|nr:hypothetical protein BDV96DRAFT_584595 [Lophiotrema nucula]